jgi:glucose-6-phosphate dehydrogenase assembly protein OpcA
MGELTWTRLAPWQEMCARMFDEPRLRLLADHITGVTLEQASAGGAPLGTEGTLLLGWLATRLGWRVPRRSTSSEYLGVDVHLVARPSSTTSRGTLLAVRLEASIEGAVFRGAMVRDAGPSDAASWRLEVQGKDGGVQHIEQHVRLRADETADLLDRTLHRPLHDPALADAVAWSDALEGEELACGLEGDNVARVCRLDRGPAGDLDP